MPCSSDALRPEGRFPGLRVSPFSAARFADEEELFAFDPASQSCSAAPFTGMVEPNLVDLTSQVSVPRALVPVLCTHSFAAPSMCGAEHNPFDLSQVNPVSYATSPGRVPANSSCLQASCAKPPVSTFPKHRRQRNRQAIWHGTEKATTQPRSALFSIQFPEWRPTNAVRQLQSLRQLPRQNPCCLTPLSMKWLAAGHSRPTHLGTQEDTSGMPLLHPGFLVDRLGG